ncbi:chromate transporter [Telmatospirillum sp.]|uniref:chromate transporter n=1 Tax=Telmatospirillum sp. TaxID=2079197 RepID=UPI0028461E79|nr:chromate transporter [Telmatospirillum sp.]MDR3441342.1 chromate transporter [Telmatospirillum sp.]
MAPDTADPSPQISRAQLFLGFLKIGLLGFGGVAPVARHILVEDRKWLSEKDYAAILGIGQVLPGANVTNASIIIGERFHGPLGSLIALSGLMAMPLVILIGLAGLYDHFSGLVPVHVAIGGTAAAAAGLVIGTALKMAKRLKPSPIALAFGLAAFAGAGILRLPLIETLLVLAPLSIAAAAWEKRR